MIRSGSMLGWAMLAALATLTAPARAGQTASGEDAYQRRCAPCHGAAGRGDGPWAGAFAPPPTNLRDGFLDRRDSADVVRFLLDGSRRLAFDPARATRRSGDVEALVAHLEKLPGIEWRRAERGEELWVARCEACHGRFGRPGPSRPPGVRQPRDLSDPAYQRATGDAELVELVRHGRAGMPAIPGFQGNDADAAALLAYVRLLSPGFELYTRWCASCHGDDGRGDQLVEPGAAPMVRFDRSYFAARDRDVLRTKVWHMLDDKKPAMPHFRGRLSEAQARAIVEYLKSAN